VPSATLPLSWTTDPALLWVILAAWLYWLGGRGVRPQPTPARRWRMAAFITGLATIVVALASPIDDWAAKLQWAHMLQHVLLLLVAPPLLALARPWNRMWRGLPFGLRRGVAHEVTRGRWSDGLRRTARFLGDRSPPGCCSRSPSASGVPFAYDATLRSPLVHATEHALFFATGLLFWTRVIDSPPWRSPLPDGASLYVASAMVVSWLLAIVSPSPARPCTPTRRRRPDPAG
jgi:cytochrome c oxidase assembly factor CtaG